MRTLTIILSLLLSAPLFACNSEARDATAADEPGVEQDVERAVERDIERERAELEQVVENALTDTERRLEQLEREAEGVTGEPEAALKEARRQLEIAQAEVVLSLRAVDVSDVEAWDDAREAADHQLDDLATAYTDAVTAIKTY